MNAFEGGARHANRGPTYPVVFLFTDIEGSTMRWERFPAAMHGALARHDAILRTAIVGRGGMVFKTIGDAFCAAFEDADAALGAALDIQRCLTEEDFRDVDGIAVRIAIHAGSAERRDDDFFGSNVNRVARLLAIGHGGQTLLSEAAAALLTAEARAGVVFDDLGSHRLKDLSKPERVTSVRPPGSTRRFPPLRSIGAFAHNLPVQVTSFIGRDREVAEITELMREHRLVTLTGAGGTGKTRASLYAAANFSDGTIGNTWFVELAGLTDGALIPIAIASAIGIVLNDATDRTASLVRALREQSLLLVLDNCEHVIDAAADVIAAILHNCPAVRVLTSSREPLAVPGEHTYRMPSLATPKRGVALTAEAALSWSAVALFVDRATAVDHRFSLTDDNAESVAEICRRLDGIALAIELAAARVSVLTPSQIRGRLDERFRVLVGTDRGVMPRQKTLRALVGWSFDLLTAEERKALRTLSIFPGSFTLDAAEAMFGSDCTVEPMDLLASLVDKSLLVADGDATVDMRYRLLESIREFAFEEASREGEVPALRRRAFTYVLERVRRSHDAWDTEPVARWEETYAADLDNLRASLVWSLEARGDVDGGRLLAAQSRRFWGRVAPTEGSYWAGLAASLCDDAVSADIRGSIALAEAQLLVALRRHQPALAAARRAIDGLAASGGPALGEAKMYAGYTLALTGEGAEAKRLLREAIGVFSQHGLAQLSASAALDLALVCFDDRDPTEARGLFEDAIERFESIRNERGVIAAIVNLAELEFMHGRTGAAIDLIDRAIALAPNAADASAYHINRSAYCIAAERWDDATAAATTALDVARRNGVGVDVAFAIQRFAAIAVLRDEDYARGATLVGHVDARLQALEGIRQYTESVEYERIVAVATASLGAGPFERYRSIGSTLSEDAVLARALPNAAKQASAGLG